MTVHHTIKEVKKILVADVKTEHFSAHPSDGRCPMSCFRRTKSHPHGIGQ